MDKLDWSASFSDLAIHFATKAGRSSESRSVQESVMESLTSISMSLIKISQQLERLLDNRE